MSDTTLPAAQPQRQAVQNIQPMLDTARFEHFQRASSALMHSSILNESVRGASPQQCFSNLMLVFDLSDRWKLPALSIAQGIAIVHNKVVYEGKLIAAMLDASLGVQLQYWWTGERGALDYRIYVSDRPFLELAPPDATPAEQMDAINKMLRPGVQIPGWRIIDGSVNDWRTFQKNSQNPNPAWTGAATQNQLAYRGAREWARRYEPAQMLGVYGDDEIDAMTLRMEARDVTPAPAGLTGGFTKPAEPIDAEVEEVDVAEAVASRDQEASQEPQEADKAPEAPKARGKRKGAAGGDDSPRAGQEKDAADLAKRGEDAKERIAVCEAMQKAAYDAARWGNTDLKGLLSACKTDEQRAYVENGFTEGHDAHVAECNEAYELGIQGTPMTPPEWFSDGDKAAERRWGDIREAWKEGADAGSAAAQEGDDSEAMGDDDDDGDAQGDPALAAIREAEPEMVDQALQDEADEEEDAIDESDAIDAFVEGLSGLESWKAIKAGLNVASKTDAWKASAPSRIAMVRAAAWKREVEIIEAGAEKLDVITDLTAFRCWIETTTDVEAIQGTWETLVHQPVFTALPEDNRAALERAVLGRIQTIQAK